MGIDQLVTGGDVDNPVVDSLEASSVTVTNSTAIKMERGTTSSTISSNTYANIFTTESEDVRNEFDTNNNAQFVPDETGKYDIRISTSFGGGITDGDTINIRVFDTDSNSKVEEESAFAQSGGNFVDSSVVFPALELSAGAIYEFQVRNRDNDMEILDESYGTCTRYIGFP